MALIDCSECGKQVSDKAVACPNCGAPIAEMIETNNAPTGVCLSGDNFISTRENLVQLAVKAIQKLNWRVDSADNSSGLITFTTGITWNSWSGVTGTISLEKIAPYTFSASGSAKQNVKGAQLLALDFGNEADGKIKKVINTMKSLCH